MFLLLCVKELLDRGLFQPFEKPRKEKKSARNLQMKMKEAAQRKWEDMKCNLNFNFSH